MPAERAEEAARLSYGRLLAVLADRTGDIPAAENALTEAFERALRTWPAAGIPDNPEGWIVTVAKNRWLDVVKACHTIEQADESVEDDLDLDRIPDKRLELMFVCAHPAIDPSVRTPLMLQVVLGFDASTIAVAYAVPTATMAGRLVRAKRRIKQARIPRADMPARLPAVLEAVYGAYAIDWQLVSDLTVREPIFGEALYLAPLLATLLDSEPETLGLAALVSLSLSRAPARHCDGLLVPLDEQDASLWDAALIAQGEALLRRAHTFGRVGRYQLEAAIQPAHCARAAGGTTNWEAVRTLYMALLQAAPTLGARVALAAVIGRIEGPQSGLTSLNAIAGAERFQPAWAARAHLLSRSDQRDAAVAAYAKAISLTTDYGMRELLASQARAYAQKT